MVLVNSVYELIEASHNFLGLFMINLQLLEDGSRMIEGRCLGVVDVEAVIMTKSSENNPVEGRRMTSNLNLQ